VIAARYFVLTVVLVSFMATSSSAAEPEESNAGLTALFVRYYSAVAQGRWNEAFQLLHDRLKTATEVRSPEELAQRHSRDQHALMQAFETFNRIEVAKTEMDLTSIKGYVKAAGDGNVAGEVTYDLLVFLKGPGRPLMYRVVTDVGLAEGRIIRITQHSMARIDPEGVGDAV
jgi:hypothetical protein